MNPLGSKPPTQERKKEIEIPLFDKNEGKQSNRNTDKPTESHTPEHLGIPFRIQIAG